MSDPLFPEAVFTIWRVTLVLVVLVAVPIVVFMLHSTWRAARSIELYARQALEAARGIASNTRDVAALDTTASVGGEMLETAGAVTTKLERAADTLAARAGKGA